MKRFLSCNNTQGRGGPGYSLSLQPWRGGPQGSLYPKGPEFRNLQRCGSPFPTAEGIFMATPARGSPLTPSASRPRAGQCGNGEKPEARTSKTASAFVSQGTLVARAEGLHPTPS